MQPDRELVDLLDRMEGDTALFARLLFPERFKRAFSPGHLRAFAALDDPSIKRLLILCHRNWGKTSIFNYAYPAKALVYGHCNFMIPVSNTHASALQQSENLKNALRGNGILRDLIGAVEGETFSKDLWQTGTGISVMPRGLGNQIRGQLMGDNRPDLLIVDDLEDGEAVLNADRRKKVKEWFYGDLLGSIDQADTNTRVVMVGTILHEKALLQELRQSPEWTTVVCPLCTPDFISLWPEYLTDDQCRDLAHRYEQQGMAHVFAREYLLEPTNARDALFKRDHFRYYDEAELDDQVVETVVIVDPTKSETQTSDYSALVAVGLGPMNKVYVRDVVNERLTTDKLYEEAWAMARRFGSTVIGYEVTGLNEFITKPFEDFIASKGGGVELIPLKPRRGTGEYSGPSKGKAGRISMLSPYYRTGRIYHNNSGVCEELENQLLAFPRSAYDDLSDALSYFIELTEDGGRYFEEDVSVGLIDEAAELAKMRQEDAAVNRRLSYAV